MTAEGFSFELRRTDESSMARLGRISTPHGVIDTPVFMPVGTVGTVKGMTIDQVKSTGAGILLGNTYHLALRPGSEHVERMGGLHNFMGWDGAILTDSGGFQIFSLSKCNKVTEHAATFQSHIDGAELELTPEESIRIQERLGSDIAMVLDHVVALPSPKPLVEEAMERSTRWASRCLDAATREQQAKFAIVQGGLDLDLRERSAEGLTALPFDGFAVGGLSVGEPPEEMYRVIEGTTPFLPQEKPRYLMGVGTPIDLIEGVSRGIDMFDCVMPTRNGRNALAFTWEGQLRLRNAKHAEDPNPLDPTCPCLACKHSRAYLRHLFISKEMLGPILVTHHNLTFYQSLMAKARKQLAGGGFKAWVDDLRQRWKKEEQLAE